MVATSTIEQVCYIKSEIHFASFKLYPSVDEQLKNLRRPEVL